MEDDIDILDGRSEDFSVQQRSLSLFDGKSCQPLGIGSDEASHMGTLFEKTVDQMTADKTGASGYEDPFSRPR